MPILEGHHLSKKYYRGKRAFSAVRDVSLALEAGEVLAFLGPNGAGKTTTIKMLAGLIVPDSGWVKIAGGDPHREPGTLAHIGAVLEGNRNLYWRLTPEENLTYFGILRGVSDRQVRRRSSALLERFDLVAKRRTPVQNLSRGMQQKVAIAAALMHDPKVLLLDEPTLGLDVEATQKVKALVREIAREGRAILLTTHQLDIAEELSGRVAIMRQGEIVIRSPTQELIRRFSGTAYSIEIDGELDSDRLDKLKALGAGIEDDRTIFVRETESLYRVLTVLEPLPLVRVKRDRGNLTEVFLSLIQDKEQQVSMEFN